MMSKFQTGSERCPYCMTTGFCVDHGYYHRYLVEYQDGMISTCSLRILRVKCTSCGHTHAILPDPLIPYGEYSLLFILTVLTYFQLHILPIAKICAHFQISISTLYRWYRLFLNHRREWMGLLASIEEDVLSFLHFCFLSMDFSVFAHSFFQKTGFSFLQSHKNPAPSQRSP